MVLRRLLHLRSQCSWRTTFTSRDTFGRGEGLFAKGLAAPYRDGAFWTFDQAVDGTKQSFYSFHAFHAFLLFWLPGKVYLRDGNVRCDSTLHSCPI